MVLLKRFIKTQPTPLDIFVCMASDGQHIKMLEFFVQFILLYPTCLFSFYYGQQYCIKILGIVGGGGGQLSYLLFLLHFIPYFLNYPLTPPALWG